jgi:hypothetical protein
MQYFFNPNHLLSHSANNEVVSRKSQRFFAAANLAPSIRYGCIATWLAVLQGKGLQPWSKLH